MAINARDAAIANVGRKRGRGKPRQFDTYLRIAVPREMHRRVELFAEQNDISNTAAYRTLIEAALTQMEGS